MPKGKVWDSENINPALDLIQNGSSINNAAKTFQIPECTLRRRLKSGEPKKTGRKSKLCIKDENELVKYAEYMSDAGQPITSKWMLQTAGRVAENR